MAVLYRTYRPQRFADVVGQEHVVTTLRNSVKAGHPAHAYLFTGSRGVGKTSIARILAKAVNCLDPKDGDACLACASCLLFADGAVLDVIEIDAASNTGVENVRELIEHVQFRPTSARYKVFIIDEVHMLSKAAFNALLKTLEEPPSHVLFILATTEIHKVPATIISRTQRFDFSRIDHARLVERLKMVTEAEHLDVPGAVIDLIAQKSDGGLRDALSLLEKISSLGAGITLESVQSLLGVTTVEASLELTALIIDKRASELPAFFERLLDTGADMALFNRDFLEYLRGMLVFKIAGTGTERIVNSEQRIVFEEQSKRVTVNEIMHLARLFLRSLKDAAYGISPELPMLLSAVEAVVGGAAPLSPVKPGVAAAVPASAVADVVRPVPAPSTSVVSSTRPEVVRPVLKHAVQSDTSVKSGFDIATIEEVRMAWPAVIGKIKEINSPLATLIKSSPLRDVTGGVISLGVHYLFHKEHLESTKVHQLIIQTTEAVVGKRLGLSFVLVKQEQSADDMIKTIDSALQVFGGELVQ